MPCALRRIRAISRVAEALAWIEKLKPRRAILTNMHVDLDYASLRARCRPGSNPPMTASASRSVKRVEACKSHRPCVCDATQFH